MNSIIRAASRLTLRPIILNHSIISKRWAHNAPLTYDFARERIMLVLRLFDKIDPEKLTLDSHFVDDLGLDSLDHVEIIMHLENEFNFEIPDKDAEKLLRPADILRYITDKEEAYKELQDLQSHHSHEQHTSHEQHKSHEPQKREFCTWSVMAKRYASGKKYPTSFYEAPPKEIKIEDIQERVMKVCSKYDKIDSSKLQIASHFVEDLGLDSLDHVEIMMELEDEFALEIPDQDAEKLLRPAEIASYIFKKEEARALNFLDRPF